MTHNQTMQDCPTSGCPYIYRYCNEFVINIKDTSYECVISVVISGNTVATQTYQYSQTFTIIAD